MQMKTLEDFKGTSHELEVSQTHNRYEFAKWYSGMEEQKVIKAYERWLIEKPEFKP